MTLALDILIGLKWQPILSILEILYHPVDILIVSLLKPSWGGDKILLTFMCLGLSAGQRYQQLREGLSLTLKVLSVVYLDMHLYRVQEVVSHCVFVSCDVVFEEGQPCHTSADVREEPLLFDMNIVPSADNGKKQVPATKVLATVNLAPVHQDPDQHVIPVEPCQSTCLPQLTNASLQSLEYQKCEAEGKGMGKYWATNTQNPQASMVTNYLDNINIFVCLADTKSSHHIPHSYKHAITTDKE